MILLLILFVPFNFYYYLCRRLIKKQMRITKNHNYQQYAALYNKGIGTVVRTFDSPTKKDEKKIANYLVVPNICILSLSLSLSSRAGLTNFLISCVRARGSPCTIIGKQRTFRSFLCSFLYFYLNRNIKYLSDKFYY